MGGKKRIEAQNVADKKSAQSLNQRQSVIQIRGRGLNRGLSGFRDYTD